MPGLNWSDSPGEYVHQSLPGKVTRQPDLRPDATYTA